MAQQQAALIAMKGRVATAGTNTQQTQPQTTQTQRVAQPASTIMAVTCTSQFPASTAAVREITLRKDLSEDQRVDALRKVMAEFNSKNQ